MTPTPDMIELEALRLDGVARAALAANLVGMHGAQLIASGECMRHVLWEISALVREPDLGHGPAGAEEFMRRWQRVAWLCGLALGHCNRPVP